MEIRGLGSLLPRESPNHLVGLIVSSPIIKCGARQRAAASWLRGPAGADGVLSPMITPTDPHGSVGTTKKPSRPFGREGFSFFELFLHHHRPRARSFDGSIPGGLVARRLGIRICERSSHPEAAL